MVELCFGVYALYRPCGRICYVGKGREGRPAGHFKWVKGHRNKHLKGIIISAGGRLHWEWLIWGISEADALAEEVRLIAHIGRHPNGPLVNLTDGGEGCSGMRHSPETKARLSEINRGKTQDPETVELRAKKMRGRKLKPRPEGWGERHAAKLRGRELSAEHRAKIGAAHVGQKRSAEARLSMSKAQKNHPVSDEARANMAAAHRGKKQSPECIERRAASLRGKPRPVEVIEKIRLAQIGRPKNPESVAKMKATMNSPECLAKTSGENHWRRRRASSERN